MKSRVFDFIMKSLIVLTVLLGIVALFKPDLIKSLIESIRGIVASLGYWNYLIIFLSSLIEAFPVLGIVVPGQNIMLIVGGFFAQQGTDNLIYAIIVASIGASVGNLIGYTLGKYHGEEFFKQYGLWFGLGLTEVKYLKKGVEKWGPIGITVGKFYPAARAFLPFVAGSMNMNKRSFHIYNIIGSVVRSVVMIVLGVVFAEYYEIIIDYLPRILIGIMLLGGLYVFLYKKKEFMKYIDDKNNEIDQKLQEDYKRKAEKKS